MARHDNLTADNLRQTLDYAEAVLGSRDFHFFHGITDRRVDFRAVVGQLIDMGAPIADWRRDARVAAITLPDTIVSVRPTDMFGNLRGDEAPDVYIGAEVELLRGIRRDHEKALIDWMFADKPPVPNRSDAGNVCAALIQWMPTVEAFVDEQPVGVAA